MGTTDHIEIKIPCRSQYLGVIRLAISGVASRMGFDYDEIEDIKIAVAEACTNSIRHAYENGLEGEIVVSAFVHEDSLEISVKDNGVSFDQHTVSRSRAPVEVGDPQALQEGGLGIFLMETLMDEVAIIGGQGSRVILKKFKKEGALSERSAN